MAVRTGRDRHVLYSELAQWWPLLSAPEEYGEEAAIFREAICTYSRRRVQTLLELGCGGGNTASHLKRHFTMTLVDRSRQMLSVSEKLNPECAHIQGDMRDLRLGRRYDAVFIGDAVVHMSSLQQLRQALETAWVHCESGGTVLAVPDWTAENFRASTDHGGHDARDRGLRYLEWTIDEDPHDRRYTTHMVYLLRERERVTASRLDRFECGLFSQAEWLGLMREVGLEATALPFDHSQYEKGTHHMFLGVRP